MIEEPMRSNAGSVAPRMSRQLNQWGYILVISISALSVGLTIATLLQRQKVRSEEGSAAIVRVASELAREGRLLTLQHQFAAAVPKLTAANTLKRGDRGTLYFLAEAQRAVGASESALDAVRELLALHPQDADAHNLLGVIYLDRKDYDLALEELRAAIRLKPTYADALGNLANTYLHIAEDRNDKALFQQAESYAKRAIEVDDTKVNYHIALAWAYQGQGNFQQAIDVYTSAAVREPTNSNIFNNMARTYLAMQKLAPALAAADRAIALDQRNVAAYFNRSDILRTMGRSAEAVNAYERAIRLDPNRLGVYINLYSLYSKLSQPGKALGSLVRGLAVAPEHPEMNLFLAGALKKEGYNSEARSHAERALLGDPSLRSRGSEHELWRIGIKAATENGRG